MGEIRLFKSRTEWKCHIETTAHKSLSTISISTAVNLSTCLSIDCCIQLRPIAVSFYYPCKLSGKRMINCYNITMLNTEAKIKEKLKIEMGDIPNSTSMSTTSHQQSWNLNGDAEEIQLYETQYPISEWDQNLGVDY
jgi:hypothetical protein